MLNAFLRVNVPLARIHAGIADPWDLPTQAERQVMYKVTYPTSDHVVGPGDVFYDLVRYDSQMRTHTHSSMSVGPDNCPHSRHIHQDGKHRPQDCR